MNDSFRRGAREGLRIFLPVSVSVVPWAIVTGVAMRSSGMSVAEALGMNLLVFAGTAQLGALPLLVAGSPLWLIALTTLVLNLRFLIFSAAMAPAFRTRLPRERLLAGYLMSDGVFAVLTDTLLKSEDADWRWGCYLAPSLLGWLIWQVAGAVGILGAAAIPANWSIGFMVTIALMVLMVPLARMRPMLVAILVGGFGTVLLRGLPMRLGLIAGIALGMLAGFAAERWFERRKAA